MNCARLGMNVGCRFATKSKNSDNNYQITITVGRIKKSRVYDHYIPPLTGGIEGKMEGCRSFEVVQEAWRGSQKKSGSCTCRSTSSTVLDLSRFFHDDRESMVSRSKGQDSFNNNYRLITDMVTFLFWLLSR